MEIWLKDKNQEHKNYDKSAQKRYFPGNNIEKILFLS